MITFRVVRMAVALATQRCVYNFLQVRPGHAVSVLLQNVVNVHHVSIRLG